VTSTILFLSAGLLTAIAATQIWSGVLKQQDRESGQGAARTVGLVAASMLLTIWAMHLIDSVTVNGINFTLATGVALATLIVQGIYLFGIMRHGIQGLGLFLLPSTALPLLLIPFLPEAHTPNWIHTSSILETSHLLISLVAYAVLTLAAIHAVMHIILDRALKKKRLSLMTQALPSLFDIERYMIAQVKVATALIALSILTGLVWQWVEYAHFALFTHKVLLALFSFGVLVLLLIKRQKASWPTRVASRVTLAAYILLLLAYFGVKLITSLLH